MIQLLERFGLGSYAREIIIGVIVLLLALILFTAFQCQGWRGRKAVEAQADQTNASGEAINKAGAAAVDTVTKRGDADAKIDADVASGQRDISNAETSDDVYAAMLRTQCLRDPSYRHDPACAVFYASPR
jgi:hypothetical protein